MSFMLPTQRDCLVSNECHHVTSSDVTRLLLGGVTLPVNCCHKIHASINYILRLLNFRYDCCVYTVCVPHPYIKS